MKKSDRLKRMIAFYFCVMVFLVALPIVLSYSLGYHIDYFPKFIIYKTGIVYIRTQPSGASVYINGRFYSDNTPAKIEELKPGTYRVEVRKEGFYPWQKELAVRPNMVTKADAIVLFPVAQEMKRIGDYEVIDFAISDKNTIYYMTTKGLLRSNIDGTNLKKLSSNAQWPATILRKKFSPDGNKMLFFDDRHIWVVYLAVGNSVAASGESARIEDVFDSPDPIIDAFWYSESNHIVVATHKDIVVVELGGQGAKNAVTLYVFNIRPRDLYYDVNTDSLYFSDLRKDKDMKEGTYLYRLDLKQKFFDKFMQRLKKELDIMYE